jgi:NAD(P)-dependent dehydrogenase (short-subunit alcohol dehydrogenase family)
MRGLKGKIAVVTGGSSGIGQAICADLAERGVQVVVLDRQPADATVELMKLRGKPGLWVQADVTNLSSVSDAACKIRTELGETDFLVNNAGGIIARKLLFDITDELWNAALALNLTAAFNTVRAFAPTMARRRSGAIVNITATSVRFVWPGATHYQAAKAGLDAFTRSIAYELAATGVRANSVAPATIATPRVSEAFQADPSHADVEANATALGRVGDPFEVASAVAFLLSDEAKYITGTEVLCDGGYSLAGQTFGNEWIGPGSLDRSEA